MAKTKKRAKKQREFTSREKADLLIWLFGTMCRELQRGRSRMSRELARNKARKTSKKSVKKASKYERDAIENFADRLGEELVRKHASRS